MTANLSVYKRQMLLEVSRRKIDANFGIPGPRETENRRFSPGRNGGKRPKTRRKRVEKQETSGSEYKADKNRRLWGGGFVMIHEILRRVHKNEKNS